MPSVAKMINIRLKPQEVVDLQRVVDEANDKAEEIGLPREVTMSGIVRLWIRERLSSESPIRRVYSAPNVLAAQEKLRGSRR